MPLSAAGFSYRVDDFRILPIRSTVRRYICGCVYCLLRVSGVHVSQIFGGKVDTSILDGCGEHISGYGTDEQSLKSLCTLIWLSNARIEYEGSACLCVPSHTLQCIRTGKYHQRF